MRQFFVPLPAMSALLVWKSASFHRPEVFFQSTSRVSQSSIVTSTSPTAAATAFALYGRVRGGRSFARRNATSASTPIICSFALSTDAGLSSRFSGGIGAAVGSTLSLGPPTFQAAGRVPGHRSA